jgi:hypothetical protein
MKLDLPKTVADPIILNKKASSAVVGGLLRHHEVALCTRPEAICRHVFERGGVGSVDTGTGSGNDVVQLYETSLFAARLINGPCSSRLPTEPFGHIRR